MEQLKDIWNISQDEIQPDRLIDKKAILEIYEKLKHEEQLQEKFRPWLLPYVIILGVSLLCGCFFYAPQNFQIDQFLGTLTITVGGGYFMLLVSKVNWFSKSCDLNQPSNSFYHDIYKSLSQKRKFQKRAIYVLHISLTIGLHLMIFGFKIQDIHIGSLLFFYGFMISLALITIPKTMKNFDAYYIFISEKYTTFIREEDEIRF